MRRPVGRAYLCALPESEREPLVAALLEAAGDQAGAVRKNLDTAFDDLRHSGVCMAVGEYQRNAYGIALPLMVGQSRTLMTLNCGAVELAPDMTAIRKRVIPELKSAASQLAGSSPVPGTIRPASDSSFCSFPANLHGVGFSALNQISPLLTDLSDGSRKPVCNQMRVSFSRYD